MHLFSYFFYDLKIQNIDLKYQRQVLYLDLKIINSYLEDVELNKPKSKDMFQKSLNKSKCRSCKYRLLCEDDCV